jgi:hypothetical protein
MNEKHRLSVYENRELMRIFATKRRDNDRREENS